MLRCLALILFATATAASDPVKALTEGITELEKGVETLTQLETDKSRTRQQAAAVEAVPDDAKIIAFFRHSFKTSGSAKLRDNLPDIPEVNTKFATGEIREEYDARTIFKHFGSASSHLAGNSKQICPVNIGKMLRRGLGMDKTSVTSDLEGDDPYAADVAPVKKTFNLWATDYHRVLGTGLQMSHGFEGNNGVPKSDMPDQGVCYTEEVECCKEGDDDEGGCDAKKWVEDRAKAAKHFLYRKLNDQGGQVSCWVVEHYRHYGAKSTLPSPTSNWQDPKHEHDTWGIGAYDYKTLQDYLKQGMCIGDGSQTDQIEDWGLPTAPVDQAANLKKYVDGLDTGLETLMGALLIDTGLEFKNRKFGKWLMTPAQYYEKNPNPELQAKPCFQEKPHLTYPYAKYVRGLAAGHYINEYSTQIDNADYKRIIPECKNGDSEECDKALQMVYEVYWPEVQRAHTLGYKNDIAVPAMSLILGAIARRADLEDMLGNTYEDMLEAAGKGAEIMEDGSTNPSGVATTGDTNESPVFNRALTDGDKKVARKALLMSSHDITTNLLRVIMEVAGLSLTPVPTYNDNVEMGTPNLVTYSFMYVFEVHPTDKKLIVKNFAQSPQQARFGCPLEGKHAMKYSQMTTVWKGDATEFIGKVAAAMSAKVVDATTVHDTVKEFLKVAAKISNSKDQ